MCWYLPSLYTDWWVRQEFWEGGSAEVARAPQVWLSALALASLLSTSAHSSLCGMQDWAFIPPCPWGEGQWKIKFCSPVGISLTSSRDHSCLVNCLLLLSSPDHDLPRAVHFQQAVLLALAQVLVRSMLEVDESWVLVCLEIKIIIFLHICIVLYCWCNSFASSISFEPHNSPMWWASQELLV